MFEKGKNLPFILKGKEVCAIIREAFHFGNCGMVCQLRIAYLTAPSQSFPFCFVLIFLLQASLSLSFTWVPLKAEFVALVTTEKILSGRRSFA